VRRGLRNYDVGPCRSSRDASLHPRESRRACSDLTLILKYHSFKSTALYRQETVSQESSAMFVPRALRLKGVRETQRPKLPISPTVHTSERSKDDALVDAMQGISTNSPTPQEEHIAPKPTTRGSNFTVKPVTPEYLAQLVAGIELIFSDYAHQEEVRGDWLQQYYRTVDGREKCK
jgi:hypothetical protein